MTFSLSGGADDSKFTINAQNGVVSFVTAPDYEAPNDSGADRVYGVELVPELAERASATLRELGVSNAVVQSFDGSGGWPENAPYDVIVVSAGAPRIPPLLVDQLADRGRMVIPVGEPEEQELAIIRRDGETYATSYDTRCRYVDLLGRYGFGRTPPLA